MAFDQTQLSLLAYANGFGIWQYQSAVDDLATISAAGYVKSPTHIMRAGHMLLIDASDARAWRACTANNGGDVTLGAITGDVGALDPGSVGTTELADAAVTVAKLAAAVQVEEISGHIVTADNKTYVLSQAAAYAANIESLTIKSGAGTCTAKVTIDGVDVTGMGSVAVSATEATATATAANAAAIGAAVALVISANSGATDVSFSVKLRRT